MEKNEMEEILCSNCGHFFPANPRIKNQKYCKRPKCQRARRAAWQRNKLATDPEYRVDQKLSWQKWAKSHPDYWNLYRKNHPEKTERNRMLQAIRNRNRKKQAPMIAKMDASKPLQFSPVGEFFLVPLIAKMDALKVKIIPVSGNL